MPNDITSWFWWVFSTIVVATIINILSDYIKPNIESVWEKFSEKRRTLNKQREAEIESRARKMLASIEYAQYWQSIFNYFHIRTTGYFVITMLGIYFIVLFISTSAASIESITVLGIHVLVSYVYFNSSGNRRKLSYVIKKYKELLDERDENKQQP